MTRRWIAIEILEAAPLKCTQGFVSRATLRLNQHEQLVRTLAAHTDWQSLSLLLHLGPITLGTCRISPWVLSLRPSMHCLHLEEALDPLAEILRDNTGAGPKTIETLRT
jgi:hypothetical protein